MHKKSKSNIKTNDGNFALCCGALCCVDHLAKKNFRHAPRLPDFGNSARCPIMNERFQIVEWFKVTFFWWAAIFNYFVDICRIEDCNDPIQTNSFFLHDTTFRQYLIFIEHFDNCLLIGDPEHNNGCCCCCWIQQQKKSAAT